MWWRMIAHREQFTHKFLPITVCTRCPSASCRRCLNLQLNLLHGSCAIECYSCHCPSIDTIRASSTEIESRYRGDTATAQISTGSPIQIQARLRRILTTHQDMVDDGCWTITAGYWVIGGAGWASTARQLKRRLGRRGMSAAATMNMMLWRMAEHHKRWGGNCMSIEEWFFWKGHILHYIVTNRWGWYQLGNVKKIRHLFVDIVVSSIIFPYLDSLR